MNLVTGATGHIGNVLVRHLLMLGKKVRALVLPKEDRRPLQGLDVEQVEGDVLNPASLRLALRGVEDVYHLAGVISILPGRHEMLRQVNVQGTRNILQAAQEAQVRRLIYTSSIHAFRRMPHGVTIDESIPFDPQNALSDYDRSKAQASLEVLAAAQQGLNAVIACPTGVIGPHDYRESEMGHLVLDCMRHPVQFYIDGAYDFVDVRDVARGLVLAGERGCCGETYILSGEQISIRGLMETVRESMGSRGLHIHVPGRLAQAISTLMPAYYRLAKTKPRFTPYAIETVVGNSVISHAKAGRELGYQPGAIRDSIRDTVQWFKEEFHQQIKPASA